MIYYCIVMSKQPLLHCHDVTFSYTHQSPALEGINLEVFNDDFLAIIGPNGGGKSTLLKLMLGLLTPESGRILCMGKPIQKARKHIGYLPQFRAFSRAFPVDVTQVVMMGGLGGNPFMRRDAELREKAHELLKLVHADGLQDRAVAALSGGQLQRILLARALMKDPKLLILDEPTCNVDQPTGEHFFELLEDLNKKMAIIVVSHDLGAVSKSAKTIACLNKTISYHHSKTLSKSDIEAAYCCHIDLIAHGHPHRVLDCHD